LLSLLIIICSYCICIELMAGEAAAGLAALFCAISPPLIDHSATIGVDVLMSLMCLVSVYAALRTYSRFGLSSLALTGLLAGLAVSSKYNALPIVVLPAMVCVLSRRLDIWPVVIAVLSPIIGFFLGSPFILASIPTFLDQLAYEVWHYGVATHVGHSAEPGWPQLMFYMKWLNTEGLGAVLTGLGTVGAVVFFVKNRSKNIIFLAFPVLFAALMIGQRTNFTRNMLVVIPFLSIIASYAFVTVLHALLTNRLARAVAITAFLVAAAWSPARLALSERSEALARHDSRLGAMSYVADTKKPLEEWAVSGQLQFPILFLNLPGVTRINQDTASSYDLYLTGFDYWIANRHLKPPSEQKELLKLAKSVEGSSDDERIVDNPNIDIFGFNPSSQLLEARLLTDPAYQIDLGAATKTADIQNCSHGPSEDYCWINSRLALVKLSRPGGEQAAQILKLQVMSPWQGQAVSFYSGSWKQDAALEPGKWQEIELTPPPNSASDTRTFFMKTTQVHSPKALGLGSEERRLGVAVKIP
ncbi:MAG: hypothetical protein DCC75_03055, partial [Proteobacteria bacterium]